MLNSLSFQNNLLPDEFQMELIILRGLIGQILSRMTYEYKMKALDLSHFGGLNLGRYEELRLKTYKNSNPLSLNYCLGSI